MALSFAGDPFLEIAVILVLAAGMGTLALLARQPLIIAFLATGILVGPSALNVIHDKELVHFLGQLGISMLLFLVGMRLDPRELRRLGLVALGIGLGQAILTALFGFGLALLLGFDATAALYIAGALTFSSTIIIVKLLADKRELDTLHGRLAIGILIVQDLLVIATLTALSFAGGSDANVGAFTLLLRAIILVVSTFVVVAIGKRWLLPRLAHSKEFLGTSAVAWAVAIAGAAELLGLSMELGAFVAGVAFATTPYRDVVGSRLVSLRDFLLLFFLVDLGGFFDLDLLGTQLVAAIALSLFVLVAKPMIVFAIMGAVGYRRRTSFLTGLSLAQISEFSLVLVALGFGLGHVASDAVGLIALVALMTIIASTYMIQGGDRIARLSDPIMRWFERVTPWREVDEPPETPGHDVLVFGLGRFGQELSVALLDRDVSVQAFDHDPAMLRQAAAKGIDARLGDADDPEFPGTLPLHGAQWVVSTIPEPHINRGLAHALRHHGFVGRIGLTGHRTEDEELLSHAEADITFLPFHDAAAVAADAMYNEPHV